MRLVSAALAAFGKLCHAGVATSVFGNISPNRLICPGHSQATRRMMDALAGLSWVSPRFWS